MKRLILFLTCMMLGTGGLLAQCFQATCIPREIKETCTVDKSKGCIDWTNGVLYAVGLGVPNKKFESKAQRMAMTLRAAKVAGMRNLLEMLEGVNISSSTTVKEGMLENDTIETQIQGKLRNVVQAGQKTMNDGSVWMTVKMYMKDIRPILMESEHRTTNADTWNSGGSTQSQDSMHSAPKQDVVVKQTPSTPTPTTVSDPNEVHYGGSADKIYSGLLVDARGTGLTPALSPKIYNESGREIYGSAAVDREFALQYGIAGYTKDIDKAKNDDRVKGNVLVLKAKGLFGGQNSDLKITDDDAGLLAQLDKNQSFLREARVMILID